jgi:very-long-chain ceramide synthase
MLLVPLILYFNWKVFTPLINPSLPNPFRPLIFISHEAPESTPDSPKYNKGPLDFLFVAYYVIFFSFVRQVITVNVFHRVGRYFGLRKPAKLDRVGEQGYAIIYFGIMGAWGVVCFASYIFIFTVAEPMVSAYHVAITHLVVSNRTFLAA